MSDGDIDDIVQEFDSDASGANCFCCCCVIEWLLNGYICMLVAFNCAAALAHSGVGELETEEFVQLVLAKMDPQKEMEDTWNFLDKDNDGEMSCPDDSMSCYWRAEMCVLLPCADLGEDYSVVVH